MPVYQVEGRIGEGAQNEQFERPERVFAAGAQYDFPGMEQWTKNSIRSPYKAK